MRVTVLMPVRDGAATLVRALASIQAQQFQDFELLVVDDGSEDASAAIVQAAGQNDRRVRLIQQPPRGIVAALNFGLEHARGEFIARMDADDESTPDRLSSQVQYMDESPHIGVLATRVAFGGDPVRSAGYARVVAWTNSLLEPEEIALNRFVESPLAHPSVMFRRCLVDLHGTYRDGAFPEDYELWLRWLDAGVLFAKLPGIMTTWHDSPGRLSRTASRCSTEAFYACKAPYLARFIQERAGHRPVYLWGAGRTTRRRARDLEALGVSFAGFVDPDPDKIGQRIGTRRVLSPGELPDRSRAFVLGYVASWGARDFTRGTLVPRGYVEGRDFVMGA